MEKKFLLFCFLVYPTLCFGSGKWIEPQLSEEEKEQIFKSMVLSRASQPILPKLSADKQLYYWFSDGFISGRHRRRQEQQLRMMSKYANKIKECDNEGKKVGKLNRWSADNN